MTLAPWSAAQRIAWAMPATEPEPRARQHLERHDRWRRRRRRRRRRRCSSTARWCRRRACRGRGRRRRWRCWRRSCSRGRTWCRARSATLRDAGVDDRDDDALAVAALPGVGHADLAQVPLVLVAGVVREAAAGRGRAGIRPPSRRAAAGAAALRRPRRAGSSQRRRSRRSRRWGRGDSLASAAAASSGAREVDAVQAVRRRVVADRDLRRSRCSPASRAETSSRKSTIRRVGRRRPPRPARRQPAGGVLSAGVRDAARRATAALRADQRGPEPQPRNQPGLGHHSDIIRLGLAIVPWGPPAQRDFTGRDTVTRPSAKTAQRLRNSSATPPSMPRSAREPSARLPGPAGAGVRWRPQPRPAPRREDSAAVEKVTKLNKKAVDEYQNLNFEEARKLLKSALEVCAQAGLENHPVTARTYVHLGIVTFTGFKQKDEAIKQFRKALEIQAGHQAGQDPGHPGGAGGLRRGGRRSRSEARGDAEPPARRRSRARAIDHEPVTKSPQGEPDRRSRRPSIPAWAPRRWCCRSARTAPTISPSAR